MELTLFHLDTYSNRLFGRTPVTLSILDDWLPDYALQLAAVHNAPDGITFLVRRGNAMEARRFTPEQEDGLHQRATLAAAWFCFLHIRPRSANLDIVTQGDHLTVYRNASEITQPNSTGHDSQLCIADHMEPFHLQEVTTLKLPL